MTLYGEEILEIIRVSSESSYRLLDSTNFEWATGCDKLNNTKRSIGMNVSLADDTVYINSSQVQTPQLLRDCFAWYYQQCLKHWPIYESFSLLVEQRYTSLT